MIALVPNFQEYTHSAPAPERNDMPYQLIALTMLLMFSSASNGKGIYPKEVSQLPSIEIADAVEMFLPSRNKDSIDWDHLSEGPILWLDDGYVSSENIETNSAWLRRGLLRINVRGKRSSILKKTKQELSWHVTYRNYYVKPGHGVQSVSIEPGTLKEACFYSNTDGCDMDPIPSLTKKGYKLEEVCAPDGLSKVVYLMTHKGVKDQYLSINTDHGSGGATVSITLWFDSMSLACEENRY